MFELDLFPLAGMNHVSVMPPFAGVSGRPRLGFIAAVVVVVVVDAAVLAALAAPAAASFFCTLWRCSSHLINPCQA